MIAHAKRLTKSKFARNVAIVASGTAGAQAITVAFSPIITRLYGPEAFGALGTFTSILAVLTPLAALSYPIAIVLPKRDADALGLAKLSLGIALAMSLLAALILTLFKAPIVDLFGLYAVEPYILLLPIAMIFSVAMAVMNHWVVRKKLFNIKAKVAILKALWLNMAKAGIGLFSPLAMVLIVLTTLGSALHALMLWAGVRKSSRGQLIEGDTVEASSGRTLAGKHRDFAYYRTPQAVLNAASQSMPVLMLASLFGPASAGFYALGKMVLGAPITLIGQSVASVFYPSVNEAVLSGGNVFNLLGKVTFALAVIGLLPFAAIVMLGPWLFAVVFGAEWNIAGEYAQWMALWLYFGFMNRGCHGAISALKLQGFFLVYEVISIVLRAAALFLGFYIYETAIASVVLFSLVGVFLNSLLIGGTLFFAYRFQFSHK